jgi:hypothetical protein
MDVLREGPLTVLSASPDVNLTAPVREVYVRARLSSPLPSNYFFLTELVNPTQSLWRRLAPGVRRSQELANRLELGKQRHRIAGYWFSRLPDFQLAEGTLDGFYVGIPEVVGRFDFLIGGSILEFKTKTVPDVSLEDVTTRYLNDLEQLVFYSALSVDEPVSNTLCFLGSGPPYQATMRAFNVRVTNHSQIRAEIRARIELLRRKLAAQDGTGLPACPYYGDMCEFQIGTCNCATSAPTPAGSIERWVEITPDPAAEARLSATRSATDIVPNIWTVRDLMLPRQRYHGHWEYEQSPEFVPYAGSAAKEAAVALLGSSVRRSDLIVAPGERNAMYERGDPEVVCARNFLRVHVPGEGTEAIPVPYIVRGSGATSVGFRPSGYHQTELALICGRTGHSAGVIALAYPEVADSPIMLFLVRFDLGRLTRFYNDAKRQLHAAIAAGNAASLPACPQDFITSCPFAGCECRRELM